MDRLYKTYGRLLAETDLSFTRYLYEKINWANKLIVIKGAKGVGKTTMLLQHIRFSKKTPLNAEASVFGTFTALQYTLVSPTQFLKAFTKILLTVLGMVILASLLHPSKAEPPMDCKPSFKVTDVR